MTVCSDPNLLPYGRGGWEHSLAESADKKNYGKLARRGMVWGAVREASRSLLFLPTAMILARLISPEEAGIAAAASFFTQLAGRLTRSASARR